MIAEPERRDQVVAELHQAHTRSAALAHPTATWQQLLGDGVQDLFADVEHDLQGRLRTVLADADQVIEQGDPQSTWATPRCGSGDRSPSSPSRTATC